jgi:hypothetical protein
MANIALAFVILAIAFAWYRTDFQVPKRLMPYRNAARPSLALAGWSILVLVVGEAAANVVMGFLDELGVHFFSPYKNADAFWHMIALRVTVGLLLGGSLIKMARDPSVRSRDIVLPDA